MPPNLSEFKVPAGAKTSRASKEARLLKAQVEAQKRKVEKMGGTPKKGGPSILNRVFDVLSRGQYASAGVAGALLPGGKKPQEALKEAAKGITGKNKMSYSQVLKDAGVKNKVVRGVAGFAGDVLLDPTTYIGVGTVKATGKLAARTAGMRAAVGIVSDPAAKKLISEAGQKAVIDETQRRLNNSIKRLTSKGEIRVARKAEKAKTVELTGSAYKEAHDIARATIPGQVALRFMGKDLVKSEKAYKGIAKLGEIVGDTKVGNTLNTAFRTSAQYPELTNRMRRMVEQAGVAHNMEKVTQMRQFFKGLTKEERREISHAIEAGDISLKRAEMEAVGMEIPESATEAAVKATRTKRVLDGATAEPESMIKGVERAQAARPKEFPRDEAGLAQRMNYTSYPTSAFNKAKASLDAGDWEGAHKALDDYDAAVLEKYGKTPKEVIPESATNEAIAARNKADAQARIRYEKISRLEEWQKDNVRLSTDAKSPDHRDMHAAKAQERGEIIQAAKTNTPEGDALLDAYVEFERVKHIKYGGRINPSRAELHKVEVAEEALKNAKIRFKNAQTTTAAMSADDALRELTTGSRADITKDMTPPARTMDELQQEYEEISDYVQSVANEYGLPPHEIAAKREAIEQLKDIENEIKALKKAEEIEPAKPAVPHAEPEPLPEAVQRLHDAILAKDADAVKEAERRIRFNATSPELETVHRSVEELQKQRNAIWSEYDRVTMDAAKRAEIIAREAEILGPKAPVEKAMADVLQNVPSAKILRTDITIEQVQPGDYVKKGNEWLKVKAISPKEDRVFVRYAKGGADAVPPNAPMRDRVARLTEPNIKMSDVPMRDIQPGDRIYQELPTEDLPLERIDFDEVADVSYTYTAQGIDKVKITFKDGSTVSRDPDMLNANILRTTRPPVEKAAPVLDRVPPATARLNLKVKGIKAGDYVLRNGTQWKRVKEVVNEGDRTTIKFVDGDVVDWGSELNVTGSVSRALTRPPSREVYNIPRPGGNGITGSNPRWSIEPVGDGFEIKGPHWDDGSWPVTTDPQNRAIVLRRAYEDTGFKPYLDEAIKEEKRALTAAKKGFDEVKARATELDKQMKDIQSKGEALEKSVPELKKAAEEAAVTSARKRALERINAPKVPEVPVGKKVIEKIAPTTPKTMEFPEEFATAPGIPKVPEPVLPKVVKKLEETKLKPTKEKIAAAPPSAPKPKPISEKEYDIELEKLTRKLDNAKDAAEHNRINAEIRALEDRVMTAGVETPYRSIVHGKVASTGKDMGEYVDYARGMFKEMFGDEAAADIFRDKMIAAAKKGKGKAELKTAAEFEMDNYVYHFFRGGTKEQRATFKAMRRKAVGSENPTFTKERHHATLEAAKEAGLKPVEEIDDILALRIGKHYQAMARRNFVHMVTEEYGTKITTAAQKTIAKENRLRPVKSAYVAKNVYFPERIAKSLEAIEAMHSNDEAAAAFIKLFDNVQNKWKFWATAANPGHHARNLMGDVWMNHLDGVVDPRRYGLAAEIMKAKKSKRALAKITLRVGKKEITAGDLLRFNADAGAVPGFTSADLGEAVDLLSASRMKHKIVEWSGVREEWARLAHFIDAMKKEGAHLGPNATQEELMKAAVKAGERVRYWNIDYGDLTGFERNVMKRAIPFYTFMRKNIPLQLEALAMRPGRVAVLPKGQHAIEAMLGTDQYGPTVGGPDVIPKWIREMAGTRLRGEGEGKNAVYFLPTLPFQDIGKYLEGGEQGIFQNLTSQLTPLVRVPVERATGRQLFSGAPLPSTSEYLTNQVPLGRNVHKGLSGELTWDRLVNYLTGAGVYEVTPEMVKGELRRQQDPLQAQIRALREKRMQR